MSKYYKALSIVFSLAILYFLIKQIDFGGVRAIFTEIRGDFLAAALLSYFALNWLRAKRFHFLLGKKIGSGRLFNISLAHNFLNNILPARTGELSYLYYVRKSGAVGMGESLASLFSARIFDTLITVLLLLAAIIPIAASVANFGRVLTMVALGLVVVILIFLLFFFWETKVLWLVNRTFAILRLDKFSIGNKLLVKIQEALIVIGKLRASRLIYTTTLFTIAIWLVIFLRVWLIALGFGLSINFWQAIFIGAFPTLISVVPFYTVGNFGIFEGATVLAMIVLGLDRELAIGFSVIFHIVNIVIAALPGLVSYLLLKRK